MSHSQVFKAGIDSRECSIRLKVLRSDKFFLKMRHKREKKTQWLFDIMRALQEKLLSYLFNYLTFISHCSLQ